MSDMHYLWLKLDCTRYRFRLIYLTHKDRCGKSFLQLSKLSCSIMSNNWSLLTPTMHVTIKLLNIINVYNFRLYFCPMRTWLVLKLNLHICILFLFLNNLAFYLIFVCLMVCLLHLFLKFKDTILKWNWLKFQTLAPPSGNMVDHWSLKPDHQTKFLLILMMYKCSISNQKKLHDITYCFTLPFHCTDVRVSGSNWDWFGCTLVWWVARQAAVAVFLTLSFQRQHQQYSNDYTDYQNYKLPSIYSVYFSDVRITESHDLTLLQEEWYFSFFKRISGLWEIKISIFMQCCMLYLGYIQNHIENASY